MKKRPIFAIFSLGFLLTGCSASEIFGSVKGFFSGLFGNKNQEEPKIEEPKEEPKEEDVGLQEAIKNNKEVKNYTYKYYYYSDAQVETTTPHEEQQSPEDSIDDIELNSINDNNTPKKVVTITENDLDHTLKRDHNKTLIKYPTDTEDSEYAEVIDGKVYIFNKTSSGWQYEWYYTLKEGEEYYSPVTIKMNLDSLFTEEAAEIVKITQTGSSYHVAAKNGVDDAIASYIERYPDDEDKIRAAYALTDEEDSFDFVVEGKYLKSYVITVVSLRRTAVDESETEFEYEISVSKFSQVYSDYNKTVVERPSGVEIPQ